MTVLAAAAARAERVRRESARIDPGMALLSALMLVPFVLGWLVGAVWTVVAIAWAAVAEGFRSGARRPTVEGPPS